VKREKKQELEMLRSDDFFAHLRTAIRGVDLEREEHFGIGVYFIASSRILANPLRLAIYEKTEGNANYIVRRVAKLLPPETFVEISSGMGQSWGSFKDHPEHRAAYLPEGDGPGNDDNPVRFEVAENQLSRVASARRDGRVVEENQNVDGAFACISAQHRFAMSYNPRWLTMILDKPPLPANPKSILMLGDMIPLTKKEIAQWHEVQRLAAKRVQQGIVLPEWTDLVVEQICNDERRARHLPAFLQAWRTMCALRSLRSSEKEILPGNELRASFEDFAATSLLLRKVFREGCWFPSTRNIFEKVQPANQATGLIHPVTGRGIRYTHRGKKLERRPLL
jgi:hypothetical protein